MKVFRITPRFKYIAVFSLVALLGATSVSHALVTEDQKLGFGSFAMRDNASTHTIIVGANGSISAAPQYLFFTDGQEALYTASGFPASTPLIINVTVDDLANGGGGEGFTISAPTVLPAIPITNAGGVATFGVGARLDSSGTGAIYLDGNFNGNITVTVNF